MGRSHAEILSVIARVEREGLVTDTQAARVAGCASGSVRRWIMRGKCGVQLDGVFSRERGCWCTSLAALDRFLRAVARREEEKRADLPAAG